MPDLVLDKLFKQLAWQQYAAPYCMQGLCVAESDHASMLPLINAPCMTVSDPEAHAVGSQTLCWRANQATAADPPLMALPLAAGALGPCACRDDEV